MINKRIAMIALVAATASPAFANELAQNHLHCGEAKSLYEANQLTAAAALQYEEKCLSLAPGTDPSAVVIGAGLGAILLAGVLGDGSSSTTTTTTP